jgi:hypothetical protein
MHQQKKDQKKGKKKQVQFIKKKKLGLRMVVRWIWFGIFRLIEGMGMGNDLSLVFVDMHEKDFIHHQQAYHTEHQVGNGSQCYMLNSPSHQDANIERIWIKSNPNMLGLL